VFPVRYRQTYRVELSFKDRMVDNVQNCDSHKPIDFKTFLNSFGISFLLL
jgi:hypothetical protein